MKKLFSNSFSYHCIIFIFAVVFVGLYNDTFWLKIHSYSIEDGNGGYFLISTIFIAYVLILSLAMELITFRITAKWLIGILVCIAGVSQYYMKTFDITINDMVIESLFNTHFSEAKEFITIGLFFSFLGYVIFPIFILYMMKLSSKTPFVKGMYVKIFFVLMYVLLISGIYLWQGSNIVFAFKSSKSIIYMTNPISTIRSGVDYVLNSYGNTKQFVHIGLDARLSEDHHKKIFVLVIGESARAANYSLNGYARDTNRYTQKLDSLVNFRNFYSCGVITAISIPCMLTNYTHQTYKKRNQSLYIDNLLDIVQRAGYETYWISNNGGSCMGDVCVRIKNIKYYNDGDFDGVMLGEIGALIKNAKKDSLIVVNLHGSHGALYYQRYPKNFEIFTPVCKDKELQKCSYQEIVNAYDNSLIYTDYFIAQVISSLQEKKGFSVGLWYLSDHGESLGEYGQYMHGGLPYALSPDFQKHIPSMIWLGRGFQGDFDRLNKQKDRQLSQDYLFHTMLDLLDIQTSVYEKQLDILE
ncbi:phosphoethanolamine transferase [Helicobacter cappadocius]|uniref:Sulfatase-like hydrolase/transferase n=1 Tax=Helicobacter cappadocius TaxID=3063998 RepID=A0AA90TEM5_9HELI|nr:MULTISPECIES: sulfatase-like hydrolase/transferase [unclassified Helicobacter]MDO7253099.1 sulfatase-like hydrolase/transferase [Helicobacter sp. faydin-H75]MDP2538775.1 sulfatase-like hydrolase/transferase [Helicobacter sp. faydin-H76]